MKITFPEFFFSATLISIKAETLSGSSNSVPNLAVFTSRSEILLLLFTALSALGGKKKKLDNARSSMHVFKFVHPLNKKFCPLLLQKKNTSQTNKKPNHLEMSLEPTEIDKNYFFTIYFSQGLQDCKTKKWLYDQV